MELLRVTATSHGVNYLPEYHAAHTGEFAARGLEVVNTPRDPWTGVLDDLADGSADVALGGLWVPAMYAGMGRDYAVVGQLNARFPMAVVTREAVDAFDWSWMLGRTVLVPGAGGTAPYEFTAGLMREAGVDPRGVSYVRDLSTDMLVELYRHGLGDAMVADPFTATVLVRDGVGHAAYRIGDGGGPMPNSVYYVRRDRLDDLQDLLVPFVHGIGAAMVALVAGDDPTPTLAAEWPDGPSPVLHDVTSELIANGTWSGTRVDPAACDRWIGILRDAGLIGSDVSHDTLLDTSALDRDDPAVTPEPSDA